MYHFLSFQFRRCAYQAKVINVFEQTSSEAVLSRISDFMPA